MTGARSAAACATPEQLGVIRAAFDALAAATTDDQYHHLDIALHRAIAVASANPLIVLLLDALGDFLLDFRVQSTRHLQARGESLAPMIEQHRQMVLSLEARDAEAAGEPMRRHLESSRAEVA